MKDLTKGYPAKVILLFAIPLMLGNIFQQLYNIVDSKIVSTYVGTAALAAVGATSVVSNTLIGFVNGLTQGFAILIANSFGAKDETRMRRYVGGTVILTAIVTVLITILGLTCIEPILKLLRTPPEIMESALSYVRILLAGTVFCSIYNMCANVLRAVGDSKTPLFCLIFSVLANVLIDLLFVAVLDMGIEGAAYATVIAQASCATLCLLYIFVRYKSLIPVEEDWQLTDWQYKELISTGFSMGLMGCIVNVGTIVLQGSINSLGTKIIAAHTAGRRVFDILMIIIFTVGFSMTTYVSQNVGAGKISRIKQGIRHVLIIVTIETTVLIIICYLFGEPIVRWITNSDDRVVIKAAVMYIRVGILFFYVLGPLFVLRSSLQGMGRKIIPVCSSILEMFVKILSAKFLVPALAYFGVALTEPISWIVMTLLLVIAYFANTPEKMFGEEK